MNTILHHQHRPSASPYPFWYDLAPKFSEMRDCFAAYLALEGAEVIEGEKPGNLINLVNRTRHCGLNPYRLWRQYGEAMLAGTGLRGRVLNDRGNSMLLYLYRDDLLREHLSRKAVAVILGKLGYAATIDPGQALDQLAARARERDFPHEIGVFLGYPLKDVLAFMGQIPIAYSCQGPWKIYGDPRPSLELADRFRECRCRMADRLSSCGDPARCLAGAASGETGAVGRC